jgi:hypothetical protein
MRTFIKWLKGLIMKRKGIRKQFENEQRDLIFEFGKKLLDLSEVEIGVDLDKQKKRLGKVHMEMVRSLDRLANTPGDDEGPGRMKRVWDGVVKLLTHGGGTGEN